jgi:hypothetical protein
VVGERLSNKANGRGAEDGEEEGEDTCADGRAERQRSRKTERQRGRKTERQRTREAERQQQQSTLIASNSILITIW